MDYIIGQRWVSHADAQLGLGIVVDFEGRRVTLAFPAVGEERTYATDNAPLTRLRFKTGDHISTIDNLELLVTGVQEQQGLLVYTGTDHHDQEMTVSELELDAFVQDAEDKGQTVVYLLQDRQVVATFGLADLIRPESRKAVDRLKEMAIDNPLPGLMCRFYQFSIIGGYKFIKNIGFSFYYINGTLVFLF